MYYDFLSVAALLFAGFMAVYATMVVLSLFRPNNPNPVKLSTYECGEKAFGSSWLRFDLRFYTVALIFLIFDLEIAFLVPWAVVFKEMGMIAVVEGLIFILILFLGLVYVWAKGDLDWVKAFTEGRALRLGPLPGEVSATETDATPAAVVGQADKGV